MQGGQWKLGKRTRRKTGMLVLASVTAAYLALHGMPQNNMQVFAKSEDEIVLRVCNWEEYIDTGDWDEEERIALDNGVEIFGEKPLYEDFEDWYFETYGRRVRVEYSCFGTNEDLYNQLNLGDTYDLVCPSEYMIMKLMAEGRLEPYSDTFYDKNNECNYYVNNVSPYIYNVMNTNEINGERWGKYAAGYMWGITGVLYNPEQVSLEEASSWKIFADERLKRQVALKDNVRDSYFAALGILKADLLTDEEFRSAPDYTKRLEDEMNDTSQETIDEAQALLEQLMGNIYSLETDSGKADMVSGKIVADYQWSGDAVYAMDQADEDDFELCFSVPKEGANLWFDGWVMLKDGIYGSADSEKQKHAAEAFVNFISRPESAVRNMYYVGYTSSIAGAQGDDTIFEYINWCYGAEDSEQDTIAYPLGYFFSGDSEDERYVITASPEQVDRQLYAQYPPEETLKRTVVMRYFNEETSKAINRMWINVRCFDIRDVPAAIWLAVIAVLLLIVFLCYNTGNRYRKFAEYGRNGG